MSLYAKYAKERMGHSCVESENHFITYTIQNNAQGDRFLFIHDLYI